MPETDIDRRGWLKAILLGVPVMAAALATGRPAFADDDDDDDDDRPRRRRRSWSRRSNRRRDDDDDDD